MNTTQLFLVEGTRRSQAPHRWHGSVEQAVIRAIQAGFRIGRRVRLGRIEGSVVGYNIGHFGRFDGASYPLLIQTEFGLTKCSLRELAAA